MRRILALGGEGKRAWTTEEWRQGGYPCRSLVGRRLAPDQPAAEGIADQCAPRRIRLDRHPLIAEVEKEHVSLGRIAAGDAAHRFNPRQPRRIERPRFVRL